MFVLAVVCSSGQVCTVALCSSSFLGKLAGGSLTARARRTVDVSGFTDDLALVRSLGPNLRLLVNENTVR